MYIIKDIDNNAYFTGNTAKGLLKDNLPKFEREKQNAREYNYELGSAVARRLVIRLGRQMKLKPKEKENEQQNNS